VWDLFAETASADGVVDAAGGMAVGLESSGGSTIGSPTLGPMNGLHARKMSTTPRIAITIKLLGNIF
jgi:hypothetical protein